jgi:ABC-type transport system involved in multi-copper enzyme maturation permease subunit
LLSWLIPAAVGLRAAVSIASERERGTWDSLLTSPLTGPEIVRAKLWGSLHALLGIFAATLIAWTWLLIADVTSPLTVSMVPALLHYPASVAGLAVQSAFMAALGIRTSLSCRSTTRALTVTIGLYLGSIVAVAVAATIAAVSVTFLVFLCELAAFRLGWASLTVGTWTITPMQFFGPSWTIAWLLLYLLLTALLTADTGLRFDRLAGRMVEGAVAQAIDRVIHDRPRPPVMILPAPQESATQPASPGRPAEMG